MGIDIAHRIGIPLSLGSLTSTPPIPISVIIPNAVPNTVNIFFNKQLSTTLPATSAFTLTDKTISSISLDITGFIVTLTVTEAFVMDDIVVLTYTQPGSNPLKSFTLDIPVASFIRSVGNLININYGSDLFDFLWTGRISGNHLLNDLDDRYITVTGMDFSGPEIPDDSTATFTLPEDSDFIEDDCADCLWFHNITQQSRYVTIAELIGNNYRTLVKYNNESPFNITMIGIPKHTTIFIPQLIDSFSQDFLLWLFWFGTLNDNGYLKDNRTMELGNVIQIGNGALTPSEAPNSPTVLTATPYSASRIDLTWINPGGAFTGNKVYGSTDNIIFTLIDTIDPTEAYSVTGLNAGEHWYFKVTTYSGFLESNASNTADTYAKLAVPTEMTLTLINGGVRVSWTPGTGVDDVEVYGKSDSGSYSLIDTISSGTTECKDFLTSVDLRYYRIRAVNGSNNSDYAEEESIAMLGAEKITNGTFANLSGWTNHATYPWDTAEASGGKLHLVSNGVDEGPDYQFIIQDASLGLVANRKYRISHDDVHTSGGNPLLTVENVMGGTACHSVGISATQSVVAYFYPTFDGGVVDIYTTAANACDVSIDNLSIKEDLAYAPQPTDVALTRITWGARVTWASHALCQTEVWRKTDSGAYTLIATVAAGTYLYDDSRYDVDMQTLSYQLRAKRGTVYSELTTEETISAVGSEMMDATWAASNHAWWDVWYGGIGDGSLLTFNGVPADQGGTKNTFFTAGKFYRIGMSVIKSGGGRMIAPYNVSGASLEFSATGTQSIIRYIPGGVSMNLYSPDYFAGQVTAVSVKENLCAPQTPSGLTLSLISGGVKIDWSGVHLNDYTQIYAKSDDGTYGLLATVNPGISTFDDTISGVTTRHYYLKSQSSEGWTSLACAEDSINL